MACEILVPQPAIEPLPPVLLELRVLTTGLPGKSQTIVLILKAKLLLAQDLSCTILNDEKVTSFSCENVIDAY